jgi:hypothetical protein
MSASMRTQLASARTLGCGRWDTGGRPDGNFHPKTSVMITLS